MISQWHVQITHEFSAFHLKIYIFRHLNDKGDAEFLHPEKEGGWRMEPVAAGTEPEPTLIFDQRDGQAILKAFAEQLAQHGYNSGGLNAYEALKAKDLHIASLEKTISSLVAKL